MGNCLVLQEKVIKIMKMDGKFLEYQPPLQVHQVLSEFSGHAISDTLSVVRRLRPDTKMRTGRTYYLLPPPLLPSTEVAKRMSILSNTIKEAADGTGVVRIKIVITKQELKEMLRKGGVLVDKMVPQLQSLGEDWFRPTCSTFLEKSIVVTAAL
ncbi:hypothetical protein HHK36_018023 [Tetracentron sinense]|uniref:Uncharacterized protein n=1 Tax=Tetracentron sinense TaxID=13715 RepID=A0A834YV84_TETSI|nr:hypothetical protein HHK36_018023 [Tetracentron sinense]